MECGKVAMQFGQFLLTKLQAACVLVVRSRQLTNPERRNVVLDQVLACLVARVEHGLQHLCPRLSVVFFNPHGFLVFVLKRVVVQADEVNDVAAISEPVV